MKKKIYFFIQSTFNHRDYKRFGFELLKSRGFELHVWDFTPMLDKKTYENFNPHDSIRNIYHKLIVNPSDFYKVSNRLNTNSTVVAYIGLKPETKFIFNYLNKNNISFGFCNLGELPIPPRSLLEKIISGLQKPTLIISKLNLLFNRKITNNIYPNFIVVGGEKSYNSHRYPKNSLTRLIESHAFDYDLYINEESKESIPIVLDDYAVFLDEYVPYHPDYYSMNIKSDCSSEKYYPDLNRFFDTIESTFDIKVIIAAHPRSDYHNKNNPFNKRRCIINKTINLVKYSKFVISHASTATNYAVLYKKPLVFILSNQYSTRFNKLIQFHSSVFRKTAINIGNNSIVIDLDMSVDEDLYKNYKQQYIKVLGTPEKSIWDIFADSIK